MGRPVRILTAFGWRIRHRGWAWITTQDSNKVMLHAHSFFVLPGKGPDSSRASQYRPVSSFDYLAYNCRRYGDGVTCTKPVAGTTHASAPAAALRRRYFSTM